MKPLRYTLVDKLVFREIFLPMAVGLLAILQLLVVFQLLQMNEVVFGAAVSAADVARITMAIAPHFLVLALPLAFMLGLQLGLGRLAGDGEILATSAAGIHPRQLFKVPVAVALALGIGVAGLTHAGEPWGLQRLSSVLDDIIKRNLESAMRPGIFHTDISHYMIYVRGQEGKDWHGVVIEDASSTGEPALILAEAGKLLDEPGGALSLQLTNGELHNADAKGQTVVRFRDGVFRISVSELLSRRNRFAGVEQAFTDAELRRRTAELEARGLREDAARLRFERVRRAVAPFACFCFALLGVPLSLRVRGARAGAYIVTIGAFVAFYGVGRLALALAERGVNVWIAGAIPLATICAPAAYYIWKLFRDGVS